MYSPVLLAAVLAATKALAFDVYATFHTSTGTISPSFDVSNEGCFAIDNAETITFSQHDEAGPAGGPYCLTAWASGYCDTTIANSTQSFQDIKVDASTKYSLTVTPGVGAGGTAEAASYMWKPTGC